MAENLPTARSMLPQTYLCLWVKFRCAKCGSRMTDKVMMGRDGYSRGSRTTLTPPAALPGIFEVSGHGGGVNKGHSRATLPKLSPD